MSVYKVATASDGTRIWWPGYQMPHGVLGATDIRDATAEESVLMEKVVWDRDTEADLRKLRELISGKAQTP